MARPTRSRRVCTEPAYDQFIPCGIAGGDRVLLTLDEYEVIRLIDLKGHTHEEAARQMQISRTTVTEIYQSARYKLADCLVNGRPLEITGGNYRLCDGGEMRCGGCRRASHLPDDTTLKGKGETDMRVAVTYENGNIFQHFGHTAQFKLYDIEDGKIVSSQVIGTNGSGHGALAGLLAQGGVDALICGGIGAGAQNALAQAGIQLFGGVQGSADEAVQALVEDKLLYNPDVHCNHHDHGEGHSCGEHHCGENKNGCHGNNCHSGN